MHKKENSRCVWELMPKGRKKEKRKPKERLPPSSYTTMPHYFPTEQVDIVRKVKSKKRIKKK